MAFIFETTQQRSVLMKKIKATDTKPEKILREALWSNGIRYRKNYPLLPGKPDIYISKHKIAIFVDGEFWHGYNWEQKKQKLNSNKEYWIPKIERNIERDRKNTAELEKMGIKVLRFWANDVKKSLPKCLEKIEQLIRPKGQGISQDG